MRRQGKIGGPAKPGFEEPSDEHHDPCGHALGVRLTGRPNSPETPRFETSDVECVVTYRVTDALG